MMTEGHLADLLAPLEARLQGESVAYNRVSTDTRTIQEGDLFVALKGPSFNAESFLAQAQAAGAVAAVVESVQIDVDLPQVQVADTRVALGQIAALNRSEYQGTVYAVTGSAGKTTVKEMLASILAQQGSVLATKGNFNNDIGAPLTLLEISSKHLNAVIELGASAVGEIDYTVQLTKPDVAILTNAMGAHLEGFGSLENIVTAKGEIFDGLTDGGWAVINFDDPHADIWLEKTLQQQRLTFSVGNPEADVWASDLQMMANGCYRFLLHTADQSIDVSLPVMGRHMVANATAAAAACITQAVALEDIAQGLAAVKPVKGRMCPLDLVTGTRLIDDSYNANPTAMKAAIDVLVDLPGSQKILVMGDMGELGVDADKLHADVGGYAAERGVDALLAVGTLSASAIKAFVSAGRSAGQLFTNHDALVVALQTKLDADTRILVKGSRSAKMDKVVDALREGE